MLTFIIRVISCFIFNQQKRKDFRQKWFDRATVALNADALLYGGGYLHQDVPLARIFNHANQGAYLRELVTKIGDNCRVLEIGSREVTGQSSLRKDLSPAQYIGFDFYPGNNVDVVGDAHKLSAYFAEQEKFDVIYSTAVFEHFAMPWIVAVEIAKMLKVGGMLLIETHFSYSSHERPWHFFQYSDMALKVLFSPALGFECIEAGMSNPMIGRFSPLACDYLKNKPITGLYCHSDYLGKKVREVENFAWGNVDLIDVVGTTKYPEPYIESIRSSFLGKQTR